MANKELNTRVIHKHDTSENWAKAVNFIPKQGELIVYDVDADYTYERFKIGDGVTLVSDLPFATDKEKLDGIEEGAVARNVWYGTTSTESAVIPKVVTTITGDFVLEKGNIIYITFENGTTANPLRLNIDNTGTKVAYLYGTTHIGGIENKSTLCFIYNGTNFQNERGGEASLSSKGIVQLNNSVSSTSTTGAATPSAVKQAYDLANAALPKAGGTMTGTLTLAADPVKDMEAATKKYVDAYSSRVVTATGDGVVYTATVSGITALTAGVSFIMIPDTASTTASPTLDVNGLGAKYIRRRLSGIATSPRVGYTTSWLAANLPFRVTYDGTQWIVEGQDKPMAGDLYGTVASATKATQDGNGNVIADTYATIAYVDELVGAILNGAS